jgi:uncharacterized protein (TIGR02246 family)
MSFGIRSHDGRRKFFVRAGLGVLVCIGCVSRSSESEARSQILEADRAWSEAAQARDVDRVLSYWADDAVVYPPGGPPVAGKPAIREFVVKSFESPGFSISWKTENVVVSRSGDLAYATGTNRVTFLGPDGKQGAAVGKAVTVWRKQKEGTWKCAIDIWNDASSPPH